MRNQRRIGELIMIACGLGIAVGGFLIGISFLSYGGPSVDERVQGRICKEIGELLRML